MNSSEMQNAVTLITVAASENNSPATATAARLCDWKTLVAFVLYARRQEAWRFIHGPVRIRRASVREIFTRGPPRTITTASDVSRAAGDPRMSLHACGYSDNNNEKNIEKKTY